MLNNATLTTIELAQQLAQDFAARADDADRRGALPAEDVRALRESGYPALTVPREFGGQELDMRDTVAVQLELAQGSTSTALVAAMQLHVIAHAREVRPWPAAIFERICRAALNGALINSVASEPVMGSPSRGGLFATTATAKPDGDGWLINGRKNWATGGRHLTHLLVGVTLDGETALMLVENNGPGIEWVETWRGALSLRASDSHDVYFRDAPVPRDHLLERQDIRFRSVPNPWFPVTVAATYLGTAFASRDAVVRYALERVPTALGKPISTLPKIQRQIGEIDVMLQAARALLFDVAGAWRPEQRAALMPRVVAAKHVATETAIMAAERALRIAGGAGVTNALPLERYFRDARAGITHPPTGDTALEIAGRHVIETVEQAHGRNGR